MLLEQPLAGVPDQHVRHVDEPPPVTMYSPFSWQSSLASAVSTGATASGSRCFLGAEGMPSSVIWVSAYGSSRLVSTPLAAPSAASDRPKAWPHHRHRGPGQPDAALQVDRQDLVELLGGLPVEHPAHADGRVGHADIQPPPPPDGRLDHGLAAPGSAASEYSATASPPAAAISATT